MLPNERLFSNIEDYDAYIIELKKSIRKDNRRFQLITFLILLASLLVIFTLLIVPVWIYGCTR